jgi:metalloendopeptidase OMA1, mitochondrial
MVMTLLFDRKLYFAPIAAVRPPKRILDIATGTGTWAIGMGDEFPDADVIGTDLSPIQNNSVPPNVWFYVEDA